MATDTLGTKIAGSEDIAAHVGRIATEVLERHPSGQGETPPLAFVGIHTGGVTFAERVFEKAAGVRPGIVLGTADISLYRDDLDDLDVISNLKRTHLPFTVEGAQVVLFDDVLFTGRTIRAAIDLLVDYGRPARIELAVLVDRGNRELPISPDYLGMTAEPSDDGRIKVLFGETEGIYLQ